jgi:hypothetical protein
MFEYNTKFTPFSLAGFRQWPYDPEETEGYILVDRDGVVDFYPAHIELYEIPKAILQVASSSGRTVRGSFHSHPTGCTTTKCFYQPPSITDLNSVHTLCDCEQVKLCKHVIVTNGRLFIIKFQRNPSQDRFTLLMQTLETLKSKNFSPEVHESHWMNTVDQFADVVSVKTMPTPR